MDTGRQPDTMSSAFKFQKLPSTTELNRLTPTTYDNGHRSQPDSPLGDSSGFANTAEIQYDTPSAPRWGGQRPSETWEAFYKLSGGIGHFVLTFSPVVFLMLAFAALSVDGQPPSRRGNVVVEASKLGPSLFPIIFAAVVGRMMRYMALWRAERGTSLGLLEQLNGSQNFLAAVERSFHLRGVGGWSLLIVILWALSPLGGQSSLRVLNLAKSDEHFSQEIYYFNPQNDSNSAFMGASAYTYGWPSISAIYQACLLAPDKVITSPTDLWNNVKIPLMEALPDYTGDPKQDWIDVPNHNDTIYSALTGIRFNGLQTNATANLTIDSAYFNLTCSEPKFFSVTDFTNTTNVFQGVRDWTGPLTYHNNVSQGIFGDPRLSITDVGYAWSSFMVDTNWNYTDQAALNQTHINMYYVSRDVNSDPFTMVGYNCSIGYSRVESKVNCQGMSCFVSQMRPSRNLTTPPNITPWNSGFSNYYSLFLSTLPWAAGQQHDGVTSPTDFFVAGNPVPFTTDTSASTSYVNVTGVQVAQRLSALANTIWQTSISKSSLVQPPTTNISALIKNMDFPYLQTTASMTIQTDVYAADKAWIALTTIISFILLACGIAGMVFKYISTAPDILGYVSSLTKDNPYFQGPVADDKLDGMERARLLRDIVVQIGNVKPWDERGYIALKSVSNGEDRDLGRLGNRTPL